MRYYSLDGNWSFGYFIRNNLTYRMIVSFAKLMDFFLIDMHAYIQGS